MIDLATFAGWAPGTPYKPPAPAPAPGVRTLQYEVSRIDMEREPLVPCDVCDREWGARHLARMRVKRLSPLVTEFEAMCWQHYGLWAEDWSVR